MPPAAAPDRPNEPPPFRLSPQEDFLAGVSYDGVTLRFGSSGTQRLQALGWSVGLVGMGVFMMLTADDPSMTVSGWPVERPEAMLAFGVATAVAGVVVAVSLLRREVVADVDGLSWRVVRPHRLSWDEVRDVVSAETADQRGGTWVDGSSIGWSARWVSSWSVGLVVLADGSWIALPTFLAAARGEGTSLGLPTATEWKVGALRRYRERAVGPWTSSPPVPRNVAVTPWWRKVVELTWPLVAWGVVWWATGGLVSPFLVLVTTVLTAWAWSNRRSRERFRVIRRDLDR